MAIITIRKWKDFQYMIVIGNFIWFPWTRWANPFLGCHVLMPVRLKPMIYFLRFERPLWNVENIKSRIISEFYRVDLQGIVRHNLHLVCNINYYHLHYVFDWMNPLDIWHGTVSSNHLREGIVWFVFTTSFSCPKRSLKRKRTKESAWPENFLYQQIRRSLDTYGIIEMKFNKPINFVF